MSIDAQVKQLDADLELFAQLVAFDPKYSECAMRGRQAFHTMVQDMRFRGVSARSRAPRGRSTEAPTTRRGRS